ncbi:UbiX family flavin prenyltransferase [Salidesulfovibrio onnuriiensis]|uniref:UbiX family flavin prenyltransferase n=1 Tax=Salidesulfovibrio onnuriiensis TaxID=2583823 RepID=UPI0011CC6DAB|nr:UbiX family flavin prenyltransferase [Salidesulfovibrio onnuriiensis]
MSKKRILLAVTGASGAQYGLEVAKALAANSSIELHLIVSEAARKVLQLEGVDEKTLTGAAHAIHAASNIAAPPASGSWLHDGMIICPCSMASLAAIAHGLGTNLIHRAADVTLKEARPLILAVRETPLSEIHLKNMLTAKQAGATILPASPGFYHKPETVEDLTRQIAGKILDQLGIPHDLFTRWGQ